jgi:exodeoxyribonuclease VII small subunit
MTNTPEPQDTSPVADFEQSLQELEKLVEHMERGDMTLAQSLAAYERGVQLFNRCQTALQEAELRVRELHDLSRPEQATAFDADDDD